MNIETLALLWPLIAIELALKALALRDLLRRQPGEVTGGRKIVWLVVILVVSTLGPIAYLVWGRRDDV